MIVSKIYGVKNCRKCEEAKRKFKKTYYVLIDDLNEEEKNALMKRVAREKIRTAPILIDEYNNIISHQEAGLG